MPADMTPEEIDKHLEDLEGKVSELESGFEVQKSRADRFEAISKLCDAEKEYFSKLDEEGQDAFLEATSEVRKSQAAEAIEKANKVPEEIQKRFDVLTKQAKDAETRAANAEAIAKREEDARKVVEFTKKAETDLPNTPGKPEEKGIMMKNLFEKLGDEDATKVVDIMKAGDAALGKLTKALGSDQPGNGADTPHAKLEALGKEIAKNEKVSIQKGYALAMERNPELATAAVGRTQ